MRKVGFNVAPWKFYFYNKRRLLLLRDPIIDVYNERRARYSALRSTIYMSREFLPIEIPMTLQGYLSVIRNFSKETLNEGSGESYKFSSIRLLSAASRRAVSRYQRR